MSFAKSTLFRHLACLTNDPLNVNSLTSWPREWDVLGSKWKACQSVTLALSNAIVTSLNNKCCFCPLQWDDLLHLTGLSSSLTVLQSWSSLSASTISAAYLFFLFFFFSCGCRSASLLILTSASSHSSYAFIILTHSRSSLVIWPLCPCLWSAIKALSSGMCIVFSAFWWADIDHMGKHTTKVMLKFFFIRRLLLCVMLAGLHQGLAFFIQSQSFLLHSTTVSC